MEQIIVYLPRPVLESQKRARKKWMEKNPDYMRTYCKEYHRSRYATDEGFRERMKASSRRHAQVKAEIRQLMNIDPSIFS